MSIGMTIAVTFPQEFEQAIDKLMQGSDEIVTITATSTTPEAERIERIGFTGHRDRRFDEDYLRRLAKAYPEATWIHGGAIGFDTQVENIAKECGIPTKPILPDYKQYGRYKAPHVRNRQIVDESDIIIAGYDGREKGGTATTIGYARNKGKRVIEIKPSE